MLQLVYLTLFVTGLIGMLINVAAEDIPLAITGAGWSILVFVLLAIASANIEVVSNGAIVASSNPYLVIVCGALALFNFLFLWTGIFEALSEALGNRPRFQER